MNSTLCKAIIFSIGAAVGSIVTWKLIKTKYEKKADDEIESVKEVLYNSYNRESRIERKEGDDLEVSRKDVPTDFGYDEKTEEVPTTSYRDYSAVLGNNKPKNNLVLVEEEVKMPYVIRPDEFDELDNYITESLTYYADHVLTDECDEIIEDVDNMVGVGSLSRFGEYEADSVFVRNDDLMTDFEILLDHSRYYDTHGEK